MLSKALAAALAVTAVSAQTFKTCSPLTSCPVAKAIGADGIDIDFTKGGNQKLIKDLAGTAITYDDKMGAVYQIKTEADAPTVQSEGYIFFGRLEVTLRAARGTGIVTSVVLQSEDLDEIDWEWLGSKNNEVQTNYFSKGCTDVYDRGGFTPVSDPVGAYHTYVIDWTPKKIDWIIDGTVVRTLVNTGIAGCSGFPQTPMRVRLGTWVGGKSANLPGVIEWAGGLANFADAPFTGYYKSLKVVDYMGGNGAKSATTYSYGDDSGDMKSIKIDDKAASGDDKSGSKQDTTSSSSGSSTSTSVTKAPSSTAGSNSTTTLSTSTTGTATAPTKASTNAPSTSTNAAGQHALSLGNVVLAGAGLLGALAL